MRAWTFTRLMFFVSLAGVLSSGSLAAQQPSSSSAVSILGTIRFADQWCSTAGTFDDTCITNAINSITVTAPYANGTVYMPAGLYTFSNPVTIPSKICVVGAAKRAIVVTWNGTGNAFTFAPNDLYAGLENLRITITNAAGVGVGMTATDCSTCAAQYNHVRNVEIGGPAAPLAGQKGLSLSAAGSGIVNSNWFEDINITGVDQPIVKTNTESNFFRDIGIDSWGVSTDNGNIAINSVSHDDQMLVRIAGSHGLNPIGYQEAGTVNIVDMDCDDAGSGTCLNLTGTGNIVRLMRPSPPQTALGAVGTNTVLDSSGPIVGVGTGGVGVTTYGSSGSILNNLASPGDANPNFNLSSIGALTWGSGGSSGADINLYRKSAGLLRTDQSLTSASFGIAGGTTPASGYTALGTTTVGALPAAAAGNAGQIIKVSDSTSIASEGQTCVGSSTNTALAFSNGSVWKCF